MYQSERPDGSELPRLAAALMRLLLPYAEREEVLSELASEHRDRKRSQGRLSAWLWAWRQVLASVPALTARSWARGWSGFSPRANRMQPGGSWLESWGMDVKFALRRLSRRRLYTALTVLTLSLGVAGTAAVYGLTKRLLLEPLPVAAEEEVAVFWAQGGWSEAEFLYMRPQIEGFRNLAAFRQREVTFQPGDAPARLVNGIAATAELFEVLGVNPAIGPGFQPGDDRVGAEPVVVLSHSFWEDLGGDVSILGRTMELGGVNRTVAGVMPPGFWYPDPTVRLWLSEELNPEDGSGNWGLIGRMAPGIRVEALDGELTRIMTIMRERFDYPPGEWDKSANPELTPLRDSLVGSIRPALLAVLAGMALILLIAGVNVSALMLGQVDSRGTEMAVRTALGAGRRRILRQVVVESLVIGFMSGLVAAGMALIAFRFLAAALPLGALAETATPDWTVLASALAIAMVAATAVSLPPAISVARSDLRGRLTRSRTSGIGGRGGNLESGLVIAQVALVLLMAAGAGLLIRSVENLRAIDPGIDSGQVAIVDVLMPTTIEPARRPPLINSLAEAVASQPGVVSAAVTQRLPLRGSSDNWGMGIEAKPEIEAATTAFRVVTPGYFSTMGIQIVAGRGLLDSDRVADVEEGVVVINQALADEFFEGMDPLGQRIRFMERWDRIVGVVENVAESGLSAEPVPARYQVHEQVPWLLPGQTMVIRVQDGRNPASVLSAARRAIQTTAPEVAIQDLTTMRNVFDRSIGPARQVMAMLSLLGGLALVLGTVGVYGVVSHFVARRKRDWSIRLALGIRPSRIVSQIVRQGGALVAAGIAVGLIAFLALARLLSSFLYEVGTADPLSIVGATALLLCAGLLAAYVPARRASRIDPALVLREQ